MSVAGQPIAEECPYTVSVRVLSISFTIVELTPCYLRGTKFVDIY
jgi:hypothetical protein